MAITAVPRPASTRDLLQRRCEGLVAAEMARLARRVPTLCATHYGEVQVALGRVIDQLVLSQVHAACDDQLASLFDLAEAPQ